MAISTVKSLISKEAKISTKTGWTSKSYTFCIDKFVFPFKFLLTAHCWKMHSTTTTNQKTNRLSKKEKKELAHSTLSNSYATFLFILIRTTRRIYIDRKDGRNKASNKVRQQTKRNCRIILKLINVLRFALLTVDCLSIDYLLICVIPVCPKILKKTMTTLLPWTIFAINFFSNF